MDTIFMNSEHGKTSNSRRLFLNLSDKKHLKKDKYVALSNISIYYTWKNIKKACKNNKLSAPKYQLQHGMKSLNYVLDHILYCIRDSRLFSIYLQKT